MNGYRLTLYYTDGTYAERLVVYPYLVKDIIRMSGKSVSHYSYAGGEIVRIVKAN